MDIPCPKCALDYHYSQERCPHCAHPGNYANVQIASVPGERNLVRQRYAAAERQASGRGCGAEFRAFAAWLTQSRAVLARSFTDVDRLASSDRNAYATYYDLTDAGLSLPDGSSWESLRRPADEVLFPFYREKIRFGALSGDGVGVLNYGSFWLTMRDRFIEDRTTVFDQNSAAFVVQHPIKTAATQLPGHRAPWGDRATLATAQLAPHLTAGIDAASFPAVLLQQGATTSDDRFIEVNIWGPLTVRTVEKVCYSQAAASRQGPAGALLQNLRRKLQAQGATLEARP